MVTQDYETNAESPYVIVGNTALLKCVIPSFVADFVSVESWSDNQSNEYFPSISKTYGKLNGNSITTSMETYSLIKSTSAIKSALCS